MQDATKPKTKICCEPDCTQALVPQPLGNFYKHKTNSDGRQNRCKACYVKKYYGNRKKKKEDDPFKAFIF